MGTSGGKILAQIGHRMLRSAQSNRCGVCGRALGHPNTTNLEHVWPKRVIHKSQSQIGDHVLAHEACNETKGDLDPTPCQVLFLFTVNRRMGLREETTKQWDQRKGSRSSCPQG